MNKQFATATFFLIFLFSFGLLESEIISSFSLGGYNRYKYSFDLTNDNKYFLYTSDEQYPYYQTYIYNIENPFDKRIFGKDTSYIAPTGIPNVVAILLFKAKNGEPVDTMPNILIYNCKTKQILSSFSFKMKFSKNRIMLSPKNKYVVQCNGSETQIMDYETKIAVSSFNWGQTNFYLRNIQWFSPDERFFKGSYIFDIEKNIKIENFGNYHFSRFSSDSKSIAVCRDSCIDLYSLEDKKLLKSLFYKNSNAFQLSEDWTKMFLSARDTVRIVNVKKDETIYKIYNRNEYTPAVINPSFTKIARFTDDSNLVHIYDVNLKKEIYSFKIGKIVQDYSHLNMGVHNSNRIDLKSFEFINDSLIICDIFFNNCFFSKTDGNDWSYYYAQEVWNVNTGKIEFRIPLGNYDAIKQFEFSNTEKYLASFSADSVIFIWQMDGKANQKKINAFPVRFIFNQEDTHLITIDSNSTLWFYDLNDGKIHDSLKCNTDGCSFMTKLPNEDRIIVTDTNKRMYIYDLKTKSLVEEKEIPIKKTEYISFFSDSSWTFWGDSASWTLQTGLLLRGVKYKPAKSAFDKYGNYYYSILSGYDFNSNVHAFFIEESKSKGTRDTSMILHNYEVMQPSPLGNYIGCIDEANTLIVLKVKEELPTSFSETTSIETRVNIFPNPLTSFGTISFNLENATKVKIEIIDIFGNRLKTIADAEYPAGENSVRFDRNGLGTGFYFYKLTANGNSFVGKFVIE